MVLVLFSAFPLISAPSIDTPVFFPSVFFQVLRLLRAAFPLSLRTSDLTYDDSPGPWYKRV